MKRLIVCSFFILALSTVAQSVPAGVAFTSEPQTVAVGVVSETITIQAQGASGNTFKLPNTGCVSLSSSASGEFSSSVSNWSAVSVLTMNKNSANRNFYYKGAAAETHTLTARLVLKPESEERSCASWPIAEWPEGWSASQNMTVGASDNDMSTQNPPPGGGFSESVPSLVVKIFGPSVATAGADAAFSAQVFGVKKELIPNARVVWSFGNGATREGASVRFAYNIPGSYIVSVDAASGGLAGMSRLVVKAVEPDIRISRVVSGADGFIEIENGGGAELDVSGWGIASGSLLFSLPDKTLILPKTKVAFPASATGVFVAWDDAQLLFPNGKVAAEYKPRETISSAPEIEPPPVVVLQNPPPAPSFTKEGETRGSGFSTSTSASIALSLSDEKSAGDISKWLWGVLGISILGIGALTAFRFKPALPKKENKSKEFAREVCIV